MKDVTITIDGETHKLVYTESDGTHDCDLCSLKLVCDNFYNPICELGRADLDKSFYFERKL